MKAAILYGKENVRVEDIEPPALEAGEVRLRIEAALTCGTDLKVFRRGYHAKMIVPPAVFGHELAGVISEVSPQASGWRVGERVVPANSAPCLNCFYCRNGQENLCEDLLFLNGAYAESVVVPARLAQENLLRLKPQTSFADAALVEPLACVAQCVEETGMHSGQRVLVIGAGPIGLMFVALGREAGCSVAVAGRSGKRLEKAGRLGAEDLFEVQKDALGRYTSLLSAIPPGRHFDVVIEAVGKPETWEAAVRLVRKGGTVNFFGGCPSGTTVTLDTALLHYSNLKLMASFHHTPRTIRRALGFVESGVIRSSDFVDGECGLSELPKLFASMAAGNHAVKTLIRVRE